MGRAPCCDKANVKKGPWSPEEDAKLKDYIGKNGTGGNWIALPQKAGLRRCGKSCRLRWLNYLRPDIKHGEFSEEEDRIICSLYANIGSRWSIIAAQLPGRTDNDIKNYWNTKLKKKLMLMGIIPNHQSQNSRKPYYHEPFSSSYCSTSTASSLLFMDCTSNYTCNNPTKSSITSLNFLSKENVPLASAGISSTSPQLFEEALARPSEYKSQGKYDSMLVFGSEGSCIDSSTYGSFGSQINYGSGREIKQEEMGTFQYFKMSSGGLEGDDWTGKLLNRQSGDNNIVLDYDYSNDVKKLLNYSDLGYTMNGDNMEVKPMYDQH